MLTRLSIRHIVLIERADIPFEEGLCVLTGETGAGKSILLDALALVLGGRGEARLIREGENEASVTASFALEADSLTALAMDDLGLPFSEELIIRRSLTRDGKQKCFINDQPVSVTALKRIGETLVEIHGQHDQRGLLDTRTHLDWLDAYGRLQTQRNEIEAAFARWQAVRRERDMLLRQAEEAARERDYLTHMVDELRKLNVSIGEEDQLTQARQRMMQGEKQASQLSEALEGLREPQPLTARLQQVSRLLTRGATAGDEALEPVLAALERATDAIAEAESGLEEALTASHYDPQKLEDSEARLFAIKAAARKYQVLADGLPEILAEAEEKLAMLGGQNDRLRQLTAQENKEKTEYLRLSQLLSVARGEAAQRMQQSLHKELEPLKMGNCRFRVVQEELTESHWTARGTDAVRYEVATNAGQPYAPLHKIASGGELSRFMLALKVVLASHKSASTLIFDEIDTGTGGAVADAIGARLVLLSDQVQILTVTHLPQVAARGAHHLFISKASKAGQTQTHVKVLDVAARKEELARMLAGAKVTDEARGAAQKLLEAAR